MVNVIPPDHVDDAPIVEPNQHDDVPVVPEPVLVDEDEDPEEDEFEEEEDPQEEDDMEVDIEEDENVLASLFSEAGVLHVNWTSLGHCVSHRVFAKEADESLAKHKALEVEIERLVRAVVSQDIMSIVQNPSVVDSLNLQTELERTKE
ncbi:hypothetical protein Tco_0199334 [Tanacetum coccineum]